ncbi:hypothetical protein C8R46DRAFT_1213228 [Mycena filopes]|nr:hypothetical protein C8R46DRAFT_1213228 [Mycena filopes]
MADLVPQEVFELVLDNLGYRSVENRKTLLVCSLVCRGWVPRSRHHLFKKCGLHNRNIDAFSRLLDSTHCTFVYQVRFVYASRNISYDDAFDRIADRLQRLVNVEILELSGLLDTSLADFRRGFLSGFPNILELRLTTHFSRTPERFIHLICVFPLLQRLVVSTQTLIPLDALSSSTYPPPPPGLINVAIARDAVQPISMWLLAQKHTEKLQSFSATFIHQGNAARHPTALTLVRDSLSRVGNSLIQLELSLDAATQPETPYYDFSTLTQLKTLKIICRLERRDDNLRYMYEALAHLPSPSLERFSLRLFRHHKEYADVNWALLDRLFNRYKFPCLLEVFISRTAPRNLMKDEPKRYGYPYLPLLQGLGVLVLGPDSFLPPLPLDDLAASFQDLALLG